MFVSYLGGPLEVFSHSAYLVQYQVGQFPTLSIIQHSFQQGFGDGRITRRCCQYVVRISCVTHGRKIPNQCY